MHTREFEHRGRAHLLVLAGGRIGQKHPIDRVITLGRSNEAAVVIDDPEASRLHARITAVAEGEYLLEDLDSRNGTFLNEVRVQRAQLNPGDRISLGGKAVVLFTQHDDAAEELLRRQRLEALGRLAAGVTHDFNNMLGAILGGLDALRDFPGASLDERRVMEILDDVTTAARRAAELTPRLLDFARTDSAYGRVDVAEICEEVARLARRTFERTIVVDCQVAAPLVVVGSGSQIHQVLMNLCLNARDAMPDGGVLSIRAEPAPATQSPAEPEGVTIAVRDDGAGIPAAAQARIFEPFFTTKKEGAGFGLGLAAVASVVAEHGGRIDLESSVGKGTAVVIWLPLAIAVEGERESNTTEPPSLLVETATGAARVLLVDDEPLVRRAVCRSLVMAGYHVVEAANGEEAIRRYSELSPKPNLVILDFDMPELSGEETLRQLQRLDPRVRTVGITGHGNPAREGAFLELGASRILRKPWKRKELLLAVSSALHDLHDPLPATVRKAFSARATLDKMPKIEPDEKP